MRFNRRHQLRIQYCSGRRYNLALYILRTMAVWGTKIMSTTPTTMTSYSSTVHHPPTV
ncbi:hypothetical protein P168DRAFT_137468 [Aspergillus campestris IBT 28561]|uniref:Uncharacterized protein n=1 Tax=Aspergillus campestris (strain IBT 28561) TaxID=1392248 RepID=A0A2I1D4A8_ASPC2|nr:uncharacterized protein P168DRAFT_137468 [Aspergillus campestris IBT 28561]PKY04688.1 hypothetical protein P168DRAFT_137468 [Aspergillus campestris IBT 28561]